MRVLRIKSHNMLDALAEARRQLGEDATVLQTKQLETPGRFGIGRRQEVEILAAAGSDVPKSVPQPAVMPVAVYQAANAYREHKTSPYLDRLVRNGVSDQLALAIESELKNVKDNTEILNIVARRIRCCGGIDFRRRQSRVVLVGPTGVGKTTTAAKLAAQHALVFGKKTALITLDTYRVGAVEQLSAYANIMGIPVEVALCPEDVDAMVAKHKDKDLIVIDTVGRSQRNRGHLAELQTFVRAADATEVHLAISASSSSAVQKEAVEGFSPLGADRVILTKLDECPQPGCILDLASAGMLPYSYITFGQEVPDDISVADSSRLARLAWEGMPW